MARNTDGKTVLVRIKRMGDQFASCGLFIRPPAHLVKQQGIRKLCPKLVPGQVMRVPADSNILNQDCIEVVRGQLYENEFERPWVFDTVEDAILANPSKSLRSTEDIIAGLAFAEGAKQTQKRKLEARLEEREDDEDDEDDNYAGNAQNRVTRGEADEARKPKEEPKEEPKAPEPARRRGRH